MVDFPTLSKQIDANSLTIESENPVNSSEDTDGGYEYTRPKFTRRPRRTFTFVYRDITAVDRATLQTFWDDNFGGSVAFNWTNPVDSVVYNVRFTKDMKLKFARDGYGAVHKFNTDPISLKEV